MRQDEIRHWVEERGGRPACMEATADDGGGIMRIDFREPDQGLDLAGRVLRDLRQTLALLEQEKAADGGLSRFGKFVVR